MSLDWDDLRLALSIANAGSMTAAARSLGLSQPTLGRRLKDLEDALGSKLFERFPNHLAATPFGIRVLDLARQMESAAVDVARLSDMRRSAGETIHISATTSVAMFLADRLDRLLDLSRAPQTSISISTTRATVDLARREADIALRMRSIPESGKLRARKIGRLAFSLYGLAADQPKASRRNVFVGLTNDRPPPQRPWLDDYAASVGGRVAHRLGEVFMRHQAIRDGQGISLLPCFVGDGDAALERIIDPPEELGEDVYLLLHEDVGPDGSTALVAEGLRLLFKEAESLLAGHVAKSPA